ncbi:MAG: hypothetical protein KGL39_14425 [Patescibacteria group bacterium]|nr:hypothetical protein [Patescibacteria group bacterium]
MKKLIKSVLMVLALGETVVFATKANAQSASFGIPTGTASIGTFLSNVAKNARAGDLVDLKLHQAGFMAVPFPAITSSDKKIEYGSLEIGADLGTGVSGTKLHGAPLFLPMFNLASIPHLIDKNASIAAHTSFPVLGDVEVGVGVLPLPISGANGKWVIGNQVVGSLQIGL